MYPYQRAARRPTVFFAFKHSDVLLTVTEWMRDDLRMRGIDAYRLIDHPLPGTNLRERAQTAIRDTNGTVLFWSQQATESAWVRAEYFYAASMRKPICLIRFPGVDKPSDWNPDVEWVDIEGISFDRPLTGIPRLLGPSITSRDAFGRMMSKIETFARFNSGLR